MKHQGSRGSLLRQTAAALSRQHVWPAVAAPPRAGDLLMMATGDRRPDFWLVAEHRPGPAGSLRLVPADVDPMCGGSDVALPDDGATGALTARCAFAVWLEAANLRPLALAGSLDDGGLEAVRRRLAALDAGEQPGTGLDRDTEAELEYRDLVAELTEARRQLVAGAGDGSPAANDPHPGTRQPSPARHFASPLALAASLLLTLALGLAAGWTWRGKRVGAGIQAATPSEPLANLPFEWLAPRAQVRGRAGEPVQVLALEPDVPFFALFLDVGVGGGETEYRLDIRRRGSAESWWRGRARRTGTAEVFVLLPTAGLEPGDYWLALYGVADPVDPRFVYELRLDPAVAAP